MTKIVWLGAAAAALALSFATIPAQAATVTNTDSKTHVVEVELVADEPTVEFVIAAGETVEVCPEGGCLLFLENEEFSVGRPGDAVKIIGGRFEGAS